MSDEETDLRVAAFMVQLFAVFPLLMGVLSLLSLYSVFSLPHLIDGFFTIVFHLVWAILSFAIGYLILSYSLTARMLINLFSLSYLAGALILMYTQYGSYVLIYSWTNLACWSPPSTQVEEVCKFPSLQVPYIGMITLVIAILGLLLFGFSKDVRKLFLKRNELDYRLNTNK
jgi:hypothetical protein